MAAPRRTISTVEAVVEAAVGRTRPTAAAVAATVAVRSAVAAPVVASRSMVGVVATVAAYLQK
jgi:hypothetical protein